MEKKLIRLRANREDKSGIFESKVSLEDLKKIWNDENITYSDLQIAKISKWLHVLAEVALKLYYHPDYERLINEFKNSTYERKESNSLCEGEYRRAS